MAGTSIENCLLHEIYKTSFPEQDLHVYEVQSRNNFRDTEGKFVAQTGTGIWDWESKERGRRPRSLSPSLHAQEQGSELELCRALGGHASHFHGLLLL